MSGDLVVSEKHQGVEVKIFLLKKKKKKKISSWTFPGRIVYGNPPANAGDTGSIPDSRKIPHIVEQLNW